MTSPAGARGRGGVLRRHSHPLSVAAALVVLVAVWQLYIWAGNVPSYQIASPAEAARAAFAHPGLLAGRCWVTAQGALLGLAASTVAALLLAMLAVRVPLVRTPLTAYALVFRTLPIVGVAPLLTMITGRGLGTSVACVVVVTVFTLLIAALEGMESLPAEVRELHDLYAAPFPRRLRTGLLPNAVGSLLVGLRVAAPMAVLAALLAEWLSGREGVGQLMTASLANRDSALLWASCVVAALLGLVAYLLPAVLVAVADRLGFAVAPTAAGTGGTR